jgi:hypothetical protein
MIIEVETKAKEPAIEKMARLITEGNVREFVNLFPTVRLKRVASSMFIHVTKSGVVKENIPQIVFHDEEYLVVASHMGFLPNKNPLAAMWVLGEEDNMLWIHRIPVWREMIPEITLYKKSDNPKIPLMAKPTGGFTKQLVKRLLGYDYDYKTHPVFEINKQVRIQGDLFCTKTFEITEEMIQDKLKKEIEDKQYYIKRDYKDDVKRAIEARILDRMPDLREELQDRRRFQNIFENNRSARDTEELAYLHRDFPHPTFYKYVLGEKELWNLRDEEMRNTDALKSPEFLEPFLTALAEKEGKARSEMAYMLSDANIHQVTKRIDNHLIIIEKAAAKNYLNEVVHGFDHIEIYEKTTAFLVHDEHGTQKIELDRGIYNFRLLPRHELG